MSDERWVLSFADVLRDGGSYGATLTRAGAEWSLLLRVEPWDHPRDLRYGQLFVAQGAAPTTEGATPLEIGSEEERAWLHALRSAETHSVGATDRLRHDEMVAILEARQRD